MIRQAVELLATLVVLLPAALRLAAGEFQLFADPLHLSGQLRLGLFEPLPLGGQEMRDAVALLLQGMREVVGPRLAGRKHGGRILHHWGP